MERRENPRFPVQFIMSFSGGAIVGEGAVSDLSKGGSKVTVVDTDEVPPGSYLTLHLSLPDQAPTLVIDMAVVRWSQGKEFGVQFLSLGI